MSARELQCAFVHPLGNAHSHITENPRTLPRTLDRTLGLKALADKVLDCTAPRTLSAQSNVQPPAYIDHDAAHYQSTVSGWLVQIEETDPAMITEVLQRCETDPEARTYFLTRANEAQT